MDIATLAILISSIALFLLIFSRYLPLFVAHCGICQRLVRKTKAVTLRCPAGKFHFHKVCFYAVKHFYNQWFRDPSAYIIQEDKKGQIRLTPINPTTQHKEE